MPTIFSVCFRPSLCLVTSHAQTTSVSLSCMCRAVLFSPFVLYLANIDVTMTVVIMTTIMIIIGKLGAYGCYSFFAITLLSQLFCFAIMLCVAFNR